MMRDSNDQISAENDLAELCHEVLTWRSSGRLPDDAKLRVLASGTHFQRFGDEAIRQAETAVMLQACKVVAGEASP